MVNRINLHSPMQAEFNSRSAIVIDPYTQVLPSWVEACQLGEGFFHIEHRELAFPGMEVAYFFTENTFSDRLVIPPEETHFALALFPHLPVLSWMGYKDATANAIAVHRTNVEYTSVMPPGWSGLYICMNNELIASLDLLPEKFWQDSRNPKRALLQVDPILLHRFREFMRSWFVRSHELHTRGCLNPEQAVILREELIGEFRQMLDRTFQERGDRAIFKPSRRYWIFETVCTMLDANLAQNLTTEEFCQKLGGSPPALQYAFKDITGVGLQEYIRAHKLNAVREEPIRRHPDEITVNAIAAKYGFFHPGRFSQQFHRQFGIYFSKILQYCR
jgi:AraC family transcriptional regulator, ethanolamine operon transcriptional activator